jgi:hypothetical protein
MSSYRCRDSEGMQPARANVARECSFVGGLVRENWPLDVQELDALEALDNDRLGELRGELVGARKHYGTELQQTQLALHAHRAARLQMRHDLAGTCATQGALDATLVRMPAHEALHRRELKCRDRAQRFNRLLTPLIVAIEMVDDEMHRRIEGNGFKTLRGHAHLFRSDQARFYRRRRRRLRRNAQRAAKRSE